MPITIEGQTFTDEEILWAQMTVAKKAGADISYDDFPDVNVSRGAAALRAITSEHNKYLYPGYRDAYNLGTTAALRTQALSGELSPATTINILGTADAKAIYPEAVDQLVSTSEKTSTPSPNVPSIFGGGQKTPEEIFGITQPAVNNQILTPTSATIILPQIDNTNTTPNHSTAITEDFGKFDPGKIFTTQSLYEKPTGMYKGTPTFELTYIDPKGISLGGGAYMALERPATSEEFNFFNTQTNYLSAGTGIRGIFSTAKEFDIIGRVSSGYTNLNTNLRTGITEPTIGKLFTALDYDPKDPRLDVTTDFLVSKGLPRPLAEGGELLAGAGLGILSDINEKPLKNIALFGAGYGAGAIIGGSIAGAAYIPKIGGIASKSLYFGSLGGGAILTGLYAKDVFGQVLTAQSPGEIGGILGVAGKDVSLIGFGFGKGSKFALKTEGLLRTFNRDYLEIGRGEYPASPISKQLGLFKKNIYLELGEKPGAFHTTGNTFWKNEIPDFLPGTSELPGLYGSTQVSTPFARLGGTSESPKLFPSVKDILTPPGKPGVAYLIPETFRYSPAIRQSNLIGEQKFPYSWKLPGRQGVADVPLIKTEIEAVFRPGTGPYGLTNKGYYTEINNIRVPIDVFSYKGKGLTGETFDILTGKTSGGYSYSLPKSYSFASPQSFGAIDLFKSSASKSQTGKVLNYSYPKSSFVSPKYSLPSVPKSSSVTSSKISSVVGSPYSSSSKSSSSKAFGSSSRGISKSSSSLSKSISRSLSSFGGYSYPGGSSKSSSSAIKGFSRGPPVFNLPLLGAPVGGSGIKTKRKFKRTPSLGAVIKMGLGIKQKKYSTALETTGLVERKVLKRENWVPNLGPYKIKEKKKKKIF